MGEKELAAHARGQRVSGLKDKLARANTLSMALSYHASLIEEFADRQAEETDRLTDEMKLLEEGLGAAVKTLGEKMDASTAAVEQANRASSKLGWFMIALTIALLLLTVVLVVR